MKAHSPVTAFCCSFERTSPASGVSFVEPLLMVRATQKHSCKLKAIKKVSHQWFRSNYLGENSLSRIQRDRLSANKLQHLFEANVCFHRVFFLSYLFPDRELPLLICYSAEIPYFFQQPIQTSPSFSWKDLTPLAISVFLWLKRFHNLKFYCKRCGHLGGEISTMKYKKP